MDVRAALLGVVLCLGLTAAAWADLAAGRAAYDSGHYGAALHELEPLAEQGDAEAQLILGKIYIFGSDQIQNFAKAAMWLRKAAEQDHGESQYWLGVAYENGRGVKRSKADAVAWIRRAAKNGFTQAQRYLLEMRMHHYQ